MRATRSIPISVFALSVTAAAFAGAFATRPRFISAVQMAVAEPSPELVERSERIVIHQFANTLRAFPELEKQNYDVRTTGNEVVFFMATPSDMRIPIQHAVAAMIENLNGRVQARGRSMFYRTAATQPLDGYLEVVVDDSHSKIVSVAAQSVPLRDLLKEIKNQIGSLSYLIPGDCAARLVDWSFGEQGDMAPKSVDTVMEELATLFDLHAQKKNGTYIFEGNCNELQQQMSPTALLRSRLMPAAFVPGDRAHVFVPLLPIGD